MKNNKHFLIPMIISMVLLPGFVAYFLYVEYQDEKAAIQLEEKDEVFNSFFAQIDTLSGESQKDKGQIVTWSKIDSGEEQIWTLQISAKDQLDSISKLPSRLSIDSITVDTMIAVFPGLKKNEHDHYFDNKFPETKTLRSLEIFKSGDLKDKPIFGLKTQKVIPMTKVISRMLPQILFSTFLLLSVFLAYWLIFRNLRNERQLAMIRNDFMSNMSHELKTPVSTIGVALEALSSFDAGDNPELRKEYIDISKHEVERLGLLVDKALNISLYEQGKFVFDRQNIDINKEIEKVLKTLKIQLDNQQVELQYDTKGSDFLINVDRTHMINVIYNLIENGIKYSAENKEINIHLVERTDFVEISISDKGRGIAPEFQNRVFEKFFRVPQGHTHDVKGHGLGLSYVKEVVDAMGGKITLKSGIDAGSTFIIKIPKADG